MGMNLRNPISRNHLLKSKLLFYNALHSNAERQTTIRRRFTTPEQQQWLHGSSLPLSTLFHSPYCKISCFLSHPTSLYFLQETKLLKNKALFYYNLGFKGSFGLCNYVGLQKDLIFRSRGFCSVGGLENCSDLEGGGDVCEGESGSVKSEEDLREVERVCKVIEELFALDRNMEAVLDECGIRLSHSLVVDVLERFKHASKTAFRFFCWAGNQAGFVHDSRTYNAMMMILGKTKDFETMSTLLEEMGEKGVLNIETFQIAIQAFAASQERMKAVEIFYLIEKYKFKVDVKTINCLLDAFGRAKLVKEALLLFWKLEQRFSPDLQTYTVLLNGWCKVRNFMEAERVWNEMTDKGFKPDVVAYNTMLRGFLDDKKLSDAIKLFEVMKTKGPAPNVRSYSIMIRDLCKQKMLEDAVRVYKEMVQSGIQPTIDTCNIMMKSFFQTRNFDMGFAAWEEMIQKGCCPNNNSYNILIGGLMKQGRSVEACKYLEEMIEKGMKAPQIDYNKFSADCSRAGKPHILKKLAQKMKFSGKLELQFLFEMCRDEQGRGKE